MNDKHPFRMRSLGNRGVALPLALIGLVAATIILTTALLTSSTEAALSNAHQRGVESLYLSDAAVDGFVTEKVSGSLFLFPGSESYTDASLNVFDLRTARLSRETVITYHPSPQQPDSMDAVRTDVFSVSAQPGNGRSGRSVGKLVSTVQNAGVLLFTLNAGATFGSDADITGNSLVSGIQNRNLCQGMGADTVNAVTHTDSTTVTYKDKNVDGEVVKDTTLSKDSLEAHVFNGKTIEELAAEADIKFGPLLHYKNVFDTSKRVSSFAYASDPSVDSLYNWGCPGAIDDKKNCLANGGDPSYYPTVAIDAQGGTVDLQGDHGQGILIVLNGNLKITGNFVYMGIIIVDGSMDVAGTGGEGTKIQGAVIATGDVQLARLDDESQITGNAMIQYNACAVAAAQMNRLEGLLDQDTQAIDNRTFGWFERVR